MNNFTKGLLLVLVIAAPVAMTAPSVQAATPKVAAAKSNKVNKNTHTTKMHKHHRHSAAKAKK
ncbi:hypothetical protein NIES4075_09040 [Tolypothrix sp. NIES-4075]|uniref:hypothetical protein n=1 Tax=Tolypothrix sp. NIES-4075 TaxID=2005459 RepID=UPI000B5CCAA4|nr:hypothetical protein [Tolypothrix sp. NIES-4075]GAX39942.1 hypothetical protein NIES4075_09040 [Tolypothrix sp. NIES-4075]